MPPPITTRTFVGYLLFILRKVPVSRFAKNHLAQKKCLKLILDMKQKVFPRNKLKLPDTRSEYIDET